MTKRKSYEILESLPTYGPMYIPISEKEERYYSEGFVVRFSKLDGTDWVANFKPGWTSLKEVHELPYNTNLLIIAFGTSYIMNPEQTKPISVFGVGYVDSFKSPDGRIILQDQTNLTIIESSGKYWHSERISWDGMKDLNLQNNIITGLSFDPMHEADEWVAFSFDINARTLTGGSYYRRYKKQKPWWKIW